MTTLKKWLVTLGISAAIVVGYAAGLLMKPAQPVAAGPASPPDADQTVPELREREGQPLPAADLIGQDGLRLDDAVLRGGKVVLVLVTASCPACKKEGEFLRTLIGKRQDVKFIGAMSFDQNSETLKSAQTLFPFAVYRDYDMKLERELNLGRVPIKIYLENGIIKRSWGGASLDATSQQAFAQWLTGLK